MEHMSLKTHAVEKLRCSADEDCDPVRVRLEVSREEQRDTGEQENLISPWQTPNSKMLPLISPLHFAATC